MTVHEPNLGNRVRVCNRALQTNDRPTRLARALQELGRLIKSLYMLRFIDDETYRRRILVQ
ncbi:MAG: Tn3 family transposase, partial [Propionivibrio sp.]|nr:Tn3 family transposase [Propionivibrio sp.]